MTTVDDKRAALLPRLADLVMALTDPEVVELSSLLDALAHRHARTSTRNVRRPAAAERKHHHE
jgi:hypothetical protein